MEQERTVIRVRDEHPISRRNIDADALKVLCRLSQHGYIAYLVGGGVRDLLLGRVPKDFDIGTSAHPNDIRRLFRNCLLIGRRFRLAHIRFGQKVIETSTFRRAPEPGAEVVKDETTGEGELFQHRDNTFGTPEEDARRRDFTINGLFYDIKTFRVIDHVGGLADLERKTIRCIGNPDIRFREDPVRMVRAVRFASRLGFTLEPATAHAVRALAPEILKASPPRMLEEIYRLFAFHSGEAAFRMLRETGLMAFMFPEIQDCVDEENTGDSLTWRCLRVLGARSELTPTLMLGGLYYALVSRESRRAREEGNPVKGMDLTASLLTPVARRFQVPKAVYYRLLHAYELQRSLMQHPPRLTAMFHRGRRADIQRVANNESFPDALALYGIYVAASGSDPGPLHAWEKVLASHPPPERREFPRRRRRRYPRRPHGAPLPPSPHAGGTASAPHR